MRKLLLLWRSPEEYCEKRGGVAGGGGGGGWGGGLETEWSIEWFYDRLATSVLLATPRLSNFYGNSKI